MPSRDLHDQMNRLMGVDPKVGRAVQKLMDSTSQLHGGRHRADAIHSVPGAMLELAKRGQLNTESAQAVIAHVLQDGIGDILVRANPVRGPYRQIAKSLVETTIAQALKAARRRR